MISLVGLPGLENEEGTRYESKTLPENSSKISVSPIKIIHACARLFTGFLPDNW